MSLSVSVNTTFQPPLLMMMIMMVIRIGKGAKTLMTWLPVLDDSFVVGSSFELVFEFRPRSHSGVLLHVGDSQPRPRSDAGHHLSLYMLRGEVRRTLTQSFPLAGPYAFVKQ